MPGPFVNEVSIPVRAYFMFNRIDLKGLMDENQANLIPHTSGKSNYAVLKFGNATSETPSPDSEATLSDSSHSYMVVFPYGSTVTFNMLDDEVDGYLEIIKRHASGLPDTSKDGASFQNYHIKYEVRENSNLPMWMQGYVMLQHLDIDGIRLISSVLGRSIALDYYVRKADGVIAAFTELPRAKWTIRSNIMRKKKNESTSWEEDPNYSQMFEYLKDQFEFNQKFVGLDFYLRLMETYMVFIGAETNRRYFVLSHGLISLYGWLVYFFSPFIPALGSLVHTIIVKTGINIT
ncbi:hypothetical protein MKW98_009587 [Papaver atlanticum]|uniref:DUF155 domain-containing protein n=1 Tax=Papaver atlanticum TaxID=357466 RepID=A0AAD4SCK6_9MAGN|nr:hypothetical protein MKW98_009587 [Papaver atlanticum]